MRIILFMFFTIVFVKNASTQTYISAETDANFGVGIPYRTTCASESVIYFMGNNTIRTLINEPINSKYRWSTVNVGLSTSDLLEAVYMNGNIYYLSIDGVFKKVNTNNWQVTNLAQWPGSIACPSGAQYLCKLKGIRFFVLSGNIYAIGGYSGYLANPTPYFTTNSNVYKYDPILNTWFIVYQLPIWPGDEPIVYNHGDSIYFGFGRKWNSNYTAYTTQGDFRIMWLNNSGNLEVSNNYSDSIPFSGEMAYSKVDNFLYFFRSGNVYKFNLNTRNLATSLNTTSIDNQQFNLIYENRINVPELGVRSYRLGDKVFVCQNNQYMSNAWQIIDLFSFRNQNQKQLNITNVSINDTTCLNQTGNNININFSAKGNYTANNKFYLEVSESPYTNWIKIDSVQAGGTIVNLNYVFQRVENKNYFLSDKKFRINSTDSYKSEEVFTNKSSYFKMIPDPIITSSRISFCNSAQPININSSITNNYLGKSELNGTNIPSTFPTNSTGIMQVIKANTNLSLDSIMLNLANSQSTNIQIWIRNGLYSGNNFNQLGWSKLVDMSNVSTIAPGYTLAIPIKIPVNIKKDSSLSIYIYSSNSSSLRLAGTPGNINNIFVSNSDAQLFYGSTCNGYFSCPIQTGINVYAASVVYKFNKGLSKAYFWKKNNSQFLTSNYSEITTDSIGVYNLQITEPEYYCSATSNSLTLSTSGITTNINITQPTNCNSNNGTIQINAQGTGNIQYKINNGQFQQNAIFSNLNAGTYIIQTKDNNQCIKIDTVTLSSTNSQSAVIGSTGKLQFCQGDSVLLSANVGSGLSYQWLLNDSAMSNSTQSIIYAKTNGNFSVRITNGFGCTSVSNVINVTVYNRPQSSFTSFNNNNALCQGDSLALTANNNNASLYNWILNGQAVVGTNSPIFYAKNIGNYTLLVVDSNGCQNVSNPLSITVNSTNPVLISSNKTSSICIGDTAIISTNITSGVSYNWYRNNNPIQGITTNSISATQSGVYYLAMSYANGCIVKSNNISVNTFTLNAIINSPLTNHLCIGDTLTLNTTYFEKYNYQWKKNGVNVGVDSNIIRVHESGNYTVTITNGNKCASTSQTINVNTYSAVPILTGVRQNNFCNGDSTMLYTAVFPTGFNYTWYRNGSIINNPYYYYDASGIVVKDDGVYQVKVSNNQNCEGTSLPYVVTVRKPNPFSIVGFDTVQKNTFSIYSISPKKNSTYNWRIVNGRGYDTTGTTLQNTGSKLAILWDNINGNGEIRTVEIDSSGCIGDTVSKQIKIANNIPSVSFSPTNPTPGSVMTVLYRGYISMENVVIMHWRCDNWSNGSTAINTPMIKQDGYWIANIIIPNNASVNFCAAFNNGNGFWDNNYGNDYKTNLDLSDKSSPVITNLFPTNNSQNVGLNTNLSITFNETVVKGNGLILVYEDSVLTQSIDVNSSKVLVNNNVVTISPSAFKSKKKIHINIQQGTFRDNNGNGFSGIIASNVWSFLTLDNSDYIPPSIISLVPNNNSESVLLGTSLEITFNEKITKNNGLISIYENSQLKQNIDVNSEKITINDNKLIIIPSVLTSNKHIYILIESGTVKDSSGNNFNGIGDSTTWSFKTIDLTDRNPPSVISLFPTNKSNNNPVLIKPSIQFSENIFKGEGNIVFFENGKQKTSINIEDTNIKIINKNTLYIDSIEFKEGSRVNVSISNKAIRDSAGN